MYKNTFVERSVPAMELDFKAIGKRIKIARIRTNMTQESVADKIGVTPATRQQYRNRKFQCQSNNACCHCESAKCISRRVAM